MVSLCITFAAFSIRFIAASSVSILTSGILGEQYLGISPVIASKSAKQTCLGEEVANNDELDLGELFGVESAALKNGDMITDTKSALVLEELIGQFLFNQSSE